MSCVIIFHRWNNVESNLAPKHKNGKYWIFIKSVNADSYFSIILLYSRRFSSQDISVLLGDTGEIWGTSSCVHISFGSFQQIQQLVLFIQIQTRKDSLCMWSLLSFMGMFSRRVLFLQFILSSLQLWGKLEIAEISFVFLIILVFCHWNAQIWGTQIVLAWQQHRNICMCDWGQSVLFVEAFGNVGRRHIWRWLQRSK